MRQHTMKGMLFAMVMLVVAVGAQAATCQLGVKGGVAIEKWGWDDIEVDIFENRTGFVGGGYFQADFNRHVGLRVEGLYFQKGATVDFGQFGFDSVAVDFTFKVDYLEFPLLLVGNFPFSDTARLSLFAGPTLGFNVNSEVELSSGGLSASADIGDAIDTFEFGLTFGAGVGFDVGSVIIGIDGRYGLGLTSVAGDQFVDLFGVADADVTNKGFAIMASIGFPVGAK